MSLQVGLFCYSTPAAAAAAACAGHVPSTTVDGGSVVTLSCSGVTEGGALLMQTSAVPVGSSASAVVSTAELPAQYQECMQADFVEAGLSILVALLVVWSLTVGPRKIIEFLRWGRGEAND